jgi:hypothetical protein
MRLLFGSAFLVFGGLQILRGQCIIACRHGTLHPYDLIPCMHVCYGTYGAVPCHQADTIPCSHPVHPYGDLIPCEAGATAKTQSPKR